MLKNLPLNKKTMKQKISPAVRQSTPKDLSRNHYTTLNFGHVYPIYVEEFCNGSKVSIRANNFSRVAPQFLPNLGRLDMKLHAFYVPYRLIWNHFENFQLGLPSWNNLGSQVYKYAPTLNDYDLTYLFSTTSFGLSESTTSSGVFDFFVMKKSGTTLTHDYYKFTPFGKYIFHVLNALGIKFSFIDRSTNTVLNEPYSLLPLLSFFKLYLDYFIPSQLQPSSSLHSLFLWIHELNANTLTLWYNDDPDPLTSQTKTQFMQRFVPFLKELYYYYQNNYFTSAWMSPNAVVPGLNNIGSTTSDRPVINSLKSQDAYNNTSVANQPLANTNDMVQRSGQASTNTNLLSSDGITFMQKFARFVKRSNFVGSRVIERILGQFGIRVTDFESNMSTYLGSTSFTMNQTDVTVTGSAQEAGDYTGKGWFNTDTDRIFKSNCDLYGMVFVTACIQPPSTYLDGVRRRNKHIQPLDFYNPDLDGSLMQAISGSELFKLNPFVGDYVSDELNETGLTPNQTFGYQLRYMEMKTSLDDISGDFCVPSLNDNIDNFILPRKIFDNLEIHDIVAGGTEDYNIQLTAYSPTVRNGDALTPIVSLKGDDMNQFNRIFRQTDGSADPVFGVFRFDVVVNNSVIPADTSAELAGRGKELEFETNGVHV